MIKTMQELQAQYGTAPEAFKAHVLNTIDHIEEAPPMKRFTFRTALITALILCLLAGAALAIGSNLGVFSFLEREKPIPKEAKEEIQTEFVQEGGDLPNISLRVRDAISDGKTLFIAVEAKTKDPADALLLSSDNIDWTDTEYINQWMSHREAVSFPNWQDIGEDQTVRFISDCGAGASITDSDGNPIYLTGGESWRYEGTDTLVFHLIFDLQPLKSPGETLQISLKTAECTQIEPTPFPDDIPRESLSPYYCAWENLAETEITVEVKTGIMPQETARSAEPFFFGDFEILEIEVTSTPLALYVRTTNRILDNGGEYGFWYSYCDPQGKPYDWLIQLHVISKAASDAFDEDPYQVRTGESIYINRDGLPDTIVLHANPPVFEGIEYKLVDDLVVPLVKDEG